MAQTILSLVDPLEQPHDAEPSPTALDEHPSQRDKGLQFSQQTMAARSLQSEDLQNQILHAVKQALKEQQQEQHLR